MVASVILLVVFILLLALLLFGLLSPFRLLLDTRSGIYFLGWRGIGSVRLIGGMEDPALRLWVLGWRKHFRLLDLAKKGKKKEEGVKDPEKKSGKKAWKRPRWLSWRLIVRLLGTFRVRQFRLQLDTGDHVQNAYWYPIFYALSGGPRQMGINFNGYNELVLDVRNRLWNVGWVFLTSIVSPKIV